MRRQRLRLGAMHPMRGQHCQDIRCGPPAHQRLGLGQAIGHQKTVMMGQICLVPLRRNHKFARHDIGSLVQQLKKCMLPAGARRPPHNRARGLRHGLARAGYAFAVTLHFKLLQIGGQ